MAQSPSRVSGWWDHVGFFSLIGIIEKNMETIGIIGILQGLYRDNGKENGSYYSMLGLYMELLRLRSFASVGVSSLGRCTKKPT